MIAREIEAKDPIQNMAAKLLRDRATAVKRAVGDGTGATILLTQAILREGVKNLAGGTSPLALKSGIERAVQVVVAEIQKMKKPVSSQVIQHVARIAAKGDAMVGKLLLEALEKAAATASSRCERRNRSKRSFISWTACASIAASCRRTSSRMRTGLSVSS